MAISVAVAALRVIQVSVLYDVPSHLLLSLVMVALLSIRASFSLTPCLLCLDCAAVNHEDTDLVQLVGSVCSIMRTNMAKKEQNLVLHVATKQQLIVKLHPPSMKRILINLLDNASKYTAARGRVTCTLDFDLSPMGGGPVITITDVGRGISAEDLEHIFEPFYQANPGAMDTTGGVGMCL